MTTRKLFLAAASMALLVFAVPAPATALDLGGVTGSSSTSSGSDRGSNGGVKAKVTLGDTKIRAYLFSNRGVAKVTAKTNILNTKAKIGVLNNDGVAQARVSTGLLNTKAKARVLSNGSIANVNVSIGGSGNGGVGGGGVGGAISGMSGAQVAALKVQCYDILANPRRFDRDLVVLCQILAEL